MKSNKKLPKWLEPAEVDRLFAVINHHLSATALRNRTMYEAMYRAGLRISEAIGLAQSEVRIESDPRVIEIRNSKKTGDDRIVPVDARLLPWLQLWKESRQHLPGGISFFCGLTGAPLHSRYIQQQIQRYAEAAQLGKKVKPHMLRHTFATELLRSGKFTIREVQALLGHSDISTTEIYTHIVQSEIQAKLSVRS